MRIISKFKDFYDYLAQDYDADIVYSRIPRWTGDLRLRNLYMSNTSWLRNNTDPTKLLHVELDALCSKSEIGDIEPSGIVFGVYPFVYSTPILKLFGRDDHGEDAWRYPSAVYIGNSFIETLENEQNLKVRCKLVSKFAGEAAKAYNKKCNNWWEKLDETVEYKVRNYQKDTILDYLKGYARKIECPEIFKILGSPAFIEENCLINFYNSPFPRKPKDKKDTKQYLVDLSFNALDPAIIKYWYNDLCDLNTYNNIENFLWSIKQEPQSEQTNSEKILSHGFDLKTSFRKM